MYVQSQSAYLEGRAVSGQGVKAYGNAEVELDSFLNLGTVWRRIISFKFQPPVNSPVASSTPLKRKNLLPLLRIEQGLLSIPARILITVPTTLRSSLYVCVCVCVYIYIYTHTHRHNVCICVCVCVYIYIHTHTHVYNLPTM